MLKNVIHIGLTVSDLDRSIDFYKNILGLKYKGQLTMEGPETDALFGIKGCKAEVAYLNGSNHIMAPAIELIQFTNEDAIYDEADLRKTSISEVCFKVENIKFFYDHLLENNVECISAPQEFDFTKYGFGKSKAIYFKDPDGIILEAIEEIE